MALYTKNLSTSAQQAEDSATTEKITVEEDTITKFKAFLDPASNGEVRAEMLVGRSGAVPDREGDPISQPGITESKNLEVELPDTPAEITFKAWAPNADFTHDVIFTIETDDSQGGFFGFR